MGPFGKPKVPFHASGTLGRQIVFLLGCRAPVGSSRYPTSETKGIIVDVGPPIVYDETSFWATGPLGLEGSTMWK